MNKIPIPEGMETHVFLMSENAINDVPALLEETFPGKRPFLIADENTYKAAGEHLFAILPAGKLPPKIYPGTPRLHPDNAYCDALAGELPEDCVPVAVGSGVINDIVKRASGIRQIPYCCVPTACSVDGYTSFGAALSVEGFKKTMPCPAPYAIAADLNILKTAPGDMLASGYADLLTKIPAGADWLLADAMGEAPIREDIWALIQKNLRKWVSDAENMQDVFMGLAATGYAMQIMRDSRPASGAEHLMSHIWEMEGLQYQGEDVSHGFKVGIGTLASSALQHFICNTPLEKARALAGKPETREEYEKRVDFLLRKGCYGNAKEVAMSKFLPPEKLLERREKIYENWEKIGSRMKEQLFTVDGFKELLAKAGCPTEFEKIGLSREQYLHGVLTAQLIRNRYTCLDLLQEAGLLEAAVKSL